MLICNKKLMSVDEKKLSKLEMGIFFKLQKYRQLRFWRASQKLNHKFFEAIQDNGKLVPIANHLAWPATSKVHSIFYVH